jgi:AraC-like DNA-binding protein
MLPEIKINLHPVNFVIISGILQSLILGVVLVFYGKGNRDANRAIGLLVMICSLHFLWSLIIDTNLADIFKPVFWFPYSYLLAIGPLLFFYTKFLTRSEIRTGINKAIHFLPVAIEVFMQLYFIRESIEQDIVHYEIRGFLLFRVIELTGTAASILIYGKHSLSLIKMHEERMVQNFSSQKDITLSWLYKLIKYLRVLWIFWLAFEMSFLVFWQFQMHLLPVYLLLYLLLGVITYSNYWIGIQALIKSGILLENVSIAGPLENPNVYARLNDAEIQRYVGALNRLMEGEKLYLHETLNLRTLAGRLQMDPNLVSYVLNNVVNKSFYDYVNGFRIEEVKRKIDHPGYAHLKIVEIAYECGFNSKATFNRVFKKHTGKSPSEYKTLQQ